ncbi:DMT family transporter [Sungkyunkwania multivorans]|uniref:DMT family transporter n=1 Tax=Sungkyunkwania multivorans TaxID=1173618 RepID=A0ABW3D3C6_9FLAO
MKQINNNKWLMLAILSLIWGSAYILIKRGLVGLSPFQLGAFRIVFTMLVLLVIGFKALKSIKGKKTWFWLAMSGFLGTFFPAFLFPYAQTELDSAITSILNSIVPLFTLIFGVFMLGVMVKRNHIIGISIGFLGLFLLLVEKIDNGGQNYFFAGYVVIATACYAININIMKKYLQEVSPMGIAVANFIFIGPPALVAMYFSGFFELHLATDQKVKTSILYVMLLAITSTAIAKVMFNRLVKMSSPVFASSVTYTIPIMGLIWGLLDNERISLLQISAMGVILVGVYMVNKRK